MRKKMQRINTKTVRQTSTDMKTLEGMQGHYMTTLTAEKEKYRDQAIKCKSKLILDCHEEYKAFF